MINNPVLLTIRTYSEARMADTIGFCRYILVKHTAFSVLSPVLPIHWIIAYKLKKSETVVPVIGACGGINDKVLTRLRVDKLLGTFIAGETDVLEATVRSLLPCLIGDAEDLAFGEVGGNSPWVLHFDS